MLVRQISFYASTFLLTLILTGCGLFTAHYDALRHQNFTNLKAYHVKFIEDHTVGEGKTWNEASTRQLCDQGELKFREAYEYAVSKDKEDMTASKAVKYLNEQFTKDCELLLKKKKLFSKAFVEGEDGILSEIIKQYNYAISGEESRVGR